MVFYEAPHKLPSTLRDMLAAWGDRRIAIVREITKIHEEVIRTTLAEAAQRFADGGAKGEIVLVIEGAKPEAAESFTRKTLWSWRGLTWNRGCQPPKPKTGCPGNRLQKG